MLSWDVRVQSKREGGREKKLNNSCACSWQWPLATHPGELNLNCAKGRLIALPVYAGDSAAAGKPRRGGQGVNKGLERVGGAAL